MMQNHAYDISYRIFFKIFYKRDYSSEIIVHNPTTQFFQMRQINFKVKANFAQKR